MFKIFILILIRFNSDRNKIIVYVYNYILIVFS